MFQEGELGLMIFLLRTPQFFIESFVTLVVDLLYSSLIIRLNNRTVSCKKKNFPILQDHIFLTRVGPSYGRKHIEKLFYINIYFNFVNIYSKLKATLLTNR